jgi:hypothetical protein
MGNADIRLIPDPEIHRFGSRLISPQRAQENGYSPSLILPGRSSPI